MFLGADTESMNDVAQTCQESAETCDDAIAFLQALVIILEAAAFFTGGSSKAYAEYLKSVVIPWLKRISAALKMFAQMLRQNADNQDQASSSQIGGLGGSGLGSGSFGAGIGSGSFGSGVNGTGAAGSTIGSLGGPGTGGLLDPATMPKGDTRSFPVITIALPQGSTVTVGMGGTGLGNTGVGSGTYAPVGAGSHAGLVNAGSMGSGPITTGSLGSASSAGPGTYAGPDALGAGSSLGSIGAGASGAGGSFGSAGAGGGSFDGGALPGASGGGSSPAGVSGGTTIGAGTVDAGLPGDSAGASAGSSVFRGDTGAGGLFEPVSAVTPHEAGAGAGTYAAAGAAGLAGLGGAGAAALAGGKGTGLTSPQGFDYNRISGVKGNPNVTEEFVRRVEQISEKIGCQPEDLMAVMSFESGGSFSAAQPNLAGGSARGLIQFMPKTAEGLGTTSEALVRMTPVQQLDYVEKYFGNRKYSSVEELYSTVLAGRRVSDPSAVLFQPGSKGYAGNKGLDVDGIGGITAKEAADAVRARIRPAGS